MWRKHTSEGGDIRKRNFGNDKQRNSGLLECRSLLFIREFLFFSHVRGAIEFQRRHDATVASSADQEIHALLADLIELRETPDVKYLRHAHLRKNQHRRYSFHQTQVERHFRVVQKPEFISVRALGLVSALISRSQKVIETARDRLGFASPTVTGWFLEATRSLSPSVSLLTAGDGSHNSKDHDNEYQQLHSHFPSGYLRADYDVQIGAPL